MSLALTKIPAHADKTELEHLHFLLSMAFAEAKRQLSDASVLPRLVVCNASHRPRFHKLLASALRSPPEGEFSNVTTSYAGKGVVHYSW